MQEIALGFPTRYWASLPSPRTENIMGNLRAIIVGAGIGGCAAALALQLVGCRVDVYEQALEKTEVGAGIQISPNASRLLQ